MMADGPDVAGAGSPRVEIAADLDGVLLVAVVLVGGGGEVRAPGEEAGHAVAPEAVAAHRRANAGEEHDAGAAARLDDVRVERELRCADERAGVRR